MVSTNYDRDTSFWLVVSTPLKNMKVIWDDDIPHIWKVIKFHGSEPPTSHFALSMMAPNHISIFISSCLHQLAASQCITILFPSGRSVPYHHGLMFFVGPQFEAK
jgi:hypothetical protein